MFETFCFGHNHFKKIGCRKDLVVMKRYYFISVRKWLGGVHKLRLQEEGG